MTFPFNITDLMKKAKDAQLSIKDIDKKLSAIEVTGKSGAEGVMSVTLTGNAQGSDLRIDISETTFEAGKQVTEELVISAFNDFLVKMNAAKKDKVKEEMDKLGIPPNMFPGGF